MLMTLLSEKYKIFDGAILKYIALATMFIDHTAKYFFHWTVSNGYVLLTGNHINTFNKAIEIMQLIGRIAFPIFCFMMVEGFCHTRNRLRYFLSILIFALLTEPIYDYAQRNTFFNFKRQNVLFELAIGFLMLLCVEKIMRMNHDYIYVKMGLILLVLIVSCDISYKINADYDYIGICLILILYLLRNERVLQAIGGQSLMFLTRYSQCYAAVAFLPLLLYNGKRGKQIKYLFYAFYPLHMVFIIFARKYFGPTITNALFQ